MHKKSQSPSLERQTTMLRRATFLVNHRVRREGSRLAGLAHQNCSSFRQPGERRNSDAERQCNNGCNQVFIQACFRSKDHGCDCRRHRAHEDHDSPFQPGQIKQQYRDQSEQEATAHPHDNSEGGQPPGATHRVKTGREPEHQARKWRGRKMERDQQFAEP